MEYKKELESYYLKGRDSGSKWNFDLEPLINNFSFYDFCTNAHTPDHGGFVVITNKQYIVGYNAGFGEGAHAYALARVMKDIHGGGVIQNQQEAIMTSGELERKYVYARIVFETDESDITHQKYQSGYLVFPLADFKNNKSITYEQFDNFIRFYEKYNEEIKYVCKKFDFFVDYTYYDEKGKITHHHSNDLDALKTYMSEHLKENTLNDEDEILLASTKTK